MEKQHAKKKNGNINDKVEKILSELTLQEKASLCSGEDFWRLKGIERLGIKNAFVCDGPHGLRKQVSSADHLGLNKSLNSVCYPAACAAACSFSSELLFNLGEHLGKEAADEEVSALLGPAINIKRSPLCGRNFEYFSEDPFLSGALASAYVSGVESKNVGACPKHFAANNQEFNRMSVSANVSKKALYEIYLPAFKRTILEAKPSLIMCAYNKINGVFCSQNKWLLRSVLRDEWGYTGAVVSDWGAVYSRVEALEGGLDLEMPGSGGFTDKQIVDAVECGKLDIGVLDEAVKNILTFILKPNSVKGITDKNKHHGFAKSVALESIVMLKNNGVLPLKKSDNVAVIGAFAKAPRYQGGGSSHINPVKVTGIEECLADARFKYFEGYDGEKINDKLIAEAVEGAKHSNVAVLFVGLPEIYESEGFDRDNMGLPPSHNALVDAVCKVQKNTVVVLYNGSVVEMPWIDKVAAVLEAYLGGEAISEAVADILLGNSSPSGKLAETFPIKLEHNPAYLNFPGDGRNVNYAEDIFVGYRYYQAKKTEVLFPFGFGLSYTSFKYSDFSVSRNDLNANTNDTVTVSVTVQNTGECYGKEVVQLYVKNDTGEFRPFNELKGFEKIGLDKGESKRVQFTVNKESLLRYCEKRERLVADTGEYLFMIGSSSEDIKFTAKISVIGDLDMPVEITNSTTVGEILKNVKAAAVMGKYLDVMRQKLFTASSKEDGDAQPFSQEALKKMAQSVPLRSVKDLGKMSEEEYSTMIAELKGAI